MTRARCTLMVFSGVELGPRERLQAQGPQVVLIIRRTEQLPGRCRGPLIRPEPVAAEHQQRVAVGIVSTGDPGPRGWLFAGSGDEPPARVLVIDGDIIAKAGGRRGEAWERVAHPPHRVDGRPLGRARLRHFHHQGGGAPDGERVSQRFRWHAVPALSQGVVGPHLGEHQVRARPEPAPPAHDAHAFTARAGHQQGLGTRGGRFRRGQLRPRGRGDVQGMEVVDGEVVGEVLTLAAEAIDDLAVTLCPGERGARLPEGGREFSVLRNRLPARAGAAPQVRSLEGSGFAAWG